MRFELNERQYQIIRRALQDARINDRVDDDEEVRLLVLWLSQQRASYHK